MKAVRSVMTVFMLIIISLAILGWRWSAILPSPKWEAARVVLALIALSAAGGLWLIWKVPPRKST
jgi:hypothetical protein